MVGGIRGWCLLSAVATGVAVGASCGDPAFKCSSNQDCSGVDGGLCELPIGSCSEPDVSCASGRAYAAHSGVLTGECVPPDGAGTGDGGTGGSAGGSGGDGPGEGGTSPPATGSADTNPGDGATGSAQTSAADSTGSTGGVPFDPCADGTVLIDEDFEVAGLSALDWALDGDGVCDVSVGDGVLTLTADASNPGDDVWLASTTMEVPNRGRLMMQVVSPPATTDSLVWLHMKGDVDDLDLEIYEDMVVTAWWDDANSDYHWETVIDYQPEQHRWLSLTWDIADGWLEFDVSDDGQTWWYLDQFDIDFAVDNVGFGGGVVADQDFNAAFASVDNVILCGY